MGNNTDSGVVVLRLGELQPGETRKFFLHCHGPEEECFVVNHDGTLHAFVDRCCHVPMSLDWIDNQFMTEDKRFIQCATHGACFLPDTGECVSGPPFGKLLTRVPLTIRGDAVIAGCPHESSDS